MPTTDIAAFKNTVTEHMIRHIGDFSGDALKITTPTISTDGFIKTTDMDGAANFTTQSSAAVPTASVIRAFGSTSNPVVKEMNIPLLETQIRDWANVAPQTAALVLGRAWNEWSDDLFTLVFSGRTVAHPDNGVSGSPYAANGGGTVYFYDNYDMTPVNGGSGYTQTNNHTLALTATNLRTLINKRRTYKDRDGKAHPVPGKPVLCVVPDLQGTAKNLVMQSGQMYSGAGLQEGFADEIADVVVAPAGATSAVDAWALIWVTDKTGTNGEVRRSSPFLSHIRALPTLRIDPQPGGGYWNLYCSFEHDNYLHPWEGDVFYSEP
jgi:hypothetical protein